MCGRRYPREASALIAGDQLQISEPAGGLPTNNRNSVIWLFRVVAFLGVSAQGCDVKLLASSGKVRCTHGLE
jgi:hypothetical protein